MIRYDKRYRQLALCLAFLAGFVDAIGFMKSGGLFVSFMSGNSTRMAIGITDAARASLSAASLIGLFVLAVFLSALLSDKITFAHRKVTALACVALLLFAAALFQSFDWTLPTVGMLCMAMGAANSTFRRDGEVTVGVTYMTGTLVKLGHRLADAATGGDRAAWQPYFFLWLALVSGGILGATSFAWAPHGSIWASFILALLLTIAAHFLTREPAHK